MPKTHGWPKKLLLILFWILIWQICSMAVKSQILLVGPLETLRSFSVQLFLPDFWAALGFSFGRICLGFFLAFFAGLVTGACAYWKPLIGEFLDPPIQFMKSIPVASFVILHFVDTLLIGMFLDSSQDAGGVIMANAREFLFWNSVFYIPLAVLIVYRYSIQGLGYSGLAMFAGVAEMFARAMVGFAMVPVFGYWAGCIASPVAWLFACAFLLPAYHFVMARLEHPAAAGTVRLRKA